ncbi:hypothetical protein C475_16561 [Halosimplex carlsbadense 2-9-1]|uniref:Uncharacterized protein n=1 Tax=Halosimplex carlsbadense 2-9-1 TaxID=797114 RepID=M0CK35_9EURY|nr:hypothetical protein [Halosimplex carlsbadense]ELZ22732.1 hypothetical protein C475_16561 [Halosimplex carlsbadense 2-9-1]
MPRAPDDSDDVPAPSVPVDRLGEGWERVEDTTETLFGVEGADVRGHTVVYEDAALRAAVREATDPPLDQSWRFLFATRLAFRPPLAPGIGPAMVLPSVKTEAVRQFADDLTDRGVVDVERGRRERIRTEDRSRVTLRQVTGEVALPDGDPVPVEGWVGARADGHVRLAGGAYPRSSLADRFPDAGPALDGSGDDYREELLALLRATG